MHADDLVLIVYRACIPTDVNFQCQLALFAILKYCDVSINIILLHFPAPCGTSMDTFPFPTIRLSYSPPPQAAITLIDVYTVGKSAQLFFSWAFVWSIVTIYTQNNGTQSLLGSYLPLLGSLPL